MVETRIARLSDEESIEQEEVAPVEWDTGPRMPDTSTMEEVTDISFGPNVYVEEDERVWFTVNDEPIGDKSYLERREIVQLLDAETGRWVSPRDRREETDVDFVTDITVDVDQDVWFEFDDDVPGPTMLFESEVQTILDSME